MKGLPQAKPTSTFGLRDCATLTTTTVVKKIVPKTPLMKEWQPVNRTPASYLQKHVPNAVLSGRTRPQTSAIPSLRPPAKCLSTRPGTSNQNIATLSSQSNLNVRTLAEVEIGKILGSGSSAVVRLATVKSSGNQLAVKCYDTNSLSDPQRRLGAEREHSILAQLQHPNIISFRGRVKVPGKLHLFMEFPGESLSLHEYVRAANHRRLELPEARTIFRQILEGLAYLHGRGFAHRDIKLENLLLCKESKRVVLIDFGFAIQDDSRQRTYCGTPAYMAPELARRKDYKSSQVDLWALGILLYRMITGTYPFSAKSDRELDHKIIEGKFGSASSVVNDSNEENLQSWKSADDCIAKLLSVNPETRPSATLLLRTHPFLQIPSPETEKPLQLVLAEKDLNQMELRPGLPSPLMPSKTSIMAKTKHLTEEERPFCIPKMKEELVIVREPSGRCSRSEDDEELEICTEDDDVVSGREQFCAAKESNHFWEDFTKQSAEFESPVEVTEDSADPKPPNRDHRLAALEASYDRRRVQPLAQRPRFQRTPLLFN